MTDGRFILVCDGFVNAADCERVVGLAERGHWYPSLVDNRFGTTVLDIARTSSSLMFASIADAWSQRWVESVEASLATVAGVDPTGLEPWQLTRYRRGERYGYHLDAGTRRGETGSNRKRTIMIVLEEPGRGGATHFRALGKTIRPRLGRLVIWPNLLEHSRRDYAMVHAGRPVWQGRKTIMTTWEHENVYHPQGR